MATDGSEWLLLVNEVGRGEIFDNRQANWSPDGTKISYAVDDYWEAEIWVSNSDGSNPQFLIGDVKHTSTHTWSPDGGKIAFISTDHELCIFDLASKTVIALSEIALSPISSPDWSPDGVSIAFSARDKGNEDIYVVNIKNMTIIRATTHEGEDLQPDWSPDGTKIAFSSTRDGDHIKDIFVIDLSLGTEEEGSVPLQVSRNELMDAEPDWSPDGSQITYYAYDFGTGHGHIFIVDAQGTAQFQVTKEPVYYSPKWMP
jgi:Tol biopolymer transport system component